VDRHSAGYPICNTLFRLAKLLIHTNQKLFIQISILIFQSTQKNILLKNKELSNQK